MSVVYDYYATGDRKLAKIYVVNQTLDSLNRVKASVKFFNLDGSEKYSKEVADLKVDSSSSLPALMIPRVSGLSSTFFIRCQLRDADDKLLAENCYWQSTIDDELGKDEQFSISQKKWADYSALNSMPQADVSISGETASTSGITVASIHLRNNSDRIAFFLRAEITDGKDGHEILPITYDDNYITLFPHESRTIQASFRQPDAALRLLL